MFKIKDGWGRSVAALAAIAICSSGTAWAGRPSGKSPWTAVKGIEPGREIRLTFRDGAETVGLMIAADDSTLHYFRPVREVLPGNVSEALQATHDRWPQIVNGGTITVNGVKLSVTGVYDGDRKVADHVAVPRDEIRAIKNPDGSTAAAAVLGFFGGLTVGGMVSYYAKAGEGTSMLLGMGSAIGGGIGAYYGAKGRAIYEAPGSRVAHLDDGTIGRLLAKLPAPLRGSQSSAQRPTSVVVAGAVNRK